MDRTGAFGEFRIEAPLGEGGSAEVYRARNAAGDVIALKILKGDLGKDERFRRRFAREVEAAMQVDHKRVVRTLDHGEVDGTLYLVQDFIDGPSLASAIETNPAGMPLDRVIRITDQAASGLGAIHDAGIVHRDVKPHNILLDEEDNAYIADFGLARDQKADRSVLTAHGQVLGSVLYMAPEQIRGEDLDRRADIYAMGCVVYECVTGRSPFGDRQGMQIMWGHLREERPDPAALRPGLGDEMVWAMDRALEKDPGKRPPTATAFAHMLSLAYSGSKGAP